MKKTLSLVLVVLMLASLSTAFAATPVAASALAYKGELEIMHFSTSEESEGNGGSDGFRTVLAAWSAAHPDITLTQNVLANAEYKTQIATLAAANDLPDVFLLQGMNTISWAKQGLVMDLTDIIKNSPYYADYTTSYFTPFTSGDKIYGFPALTGGTCTVVVYDKAMWAEAGFDTFPTTWADVEKASEYFKQQEPLHHFLRNGGQWQLNPASSPLWQQLHRSRMVQQLSKRAARNSRIACGGSDETQRMFTKTKILMLIQRCNQRRCPRVLHRRQGCCFHRRQLGRVLHRHHHQSCQRRQV